MIREIMGGRENQEISVVLVRMTAALSEHSSALLFFLSNSNNIRRRTTMRSRDGRELNPGDRGGVVILSIAAVAVIWRIKLE
jgi:hypothetical protein